MRDNRERLKDILEAIDGIEKYANRGKQVFEQDELIQIWIIHHLQIIGEASAAMSQSFIANYPEIPWQDMSDFRNVLVHEYFRVDTEIVWNVVVR
ncbi:MAG: DUF86 domain-containing protein [Xenococcaceae cyanobacterium MO_188.B19]|nr:DUF86 domain-containing protein [Xenococcaceae cyanobacterium MO_188.B19]